MKTMMLVWTGTTIPPPTPVPAPPPPQRQGAAGVLSHPIWSGRSSAHQKCPGRRALRAVSPARMTCPVRSSPVDTNAELLGTFAEGRAFGREEFRTAEAVDHQKLTYVWLCGDRSPGPPPRRPAQGAPPARTRAMAVVREANMQPFLSRWPGGLDAAYTLGGRIADAVLLLTQAMEQGAATETGGLHRTASLPGGGQGSDWPPGGGAGPCRAGTSARPVRTRNGGIRRMPCASSAICQAW